MKITIEGVTLEADADAIADIIKKLNAKYHPEKIADSKLPIADSKLPIGNWQPKRGRPKKAVLKPGCGRDNTPRPRITKHSLAKDTYVPVDTREEITNA